MRLVSNLAVAMMLAMGASAVVATPALAAKKEEAAKAPKLNLSKEFSGPASKAQDAIGKKDFEAAKAALAEADAAAKNNDEKYMAASLRLNAGIGMQDAAMQRQALEGMIASGSAPAADLPKFHFFAGDFAMKAKDYAGAQTHLQQSIQGGYPGSGPRLLLAESYFQQAIATSPSGNFSPAAKQLAAQGLPFLKQAIEEEKKTGNAIPAAWYTRGFQMAYASGSPDVAQWSAMNLEAAPNATNWRNTLRVYQDSHKGLTKPENLDVMRLMRETGALQSEADYAEYADAAATSGLPGEAKTVIDMGRSSGKLPASKLVEVYQQASERIAGDKSSLPSGERDAAKAASGKLAASTANAYLGYGDYAKAAELYRIALQKGQVDADEINTRLGISLAKSGDAAGAKAAFEAVKGGARKDIAGFWLLWLAKKA